MAENAYEQPVKFRESLFEFEREAIRLVGYGDLLDLAEEDEVNLQEIIADINGIEDRYLTFSQLTKIRHKILRPIEASSLFIVGLLEVETFVKNTVFFLMMLCIAFIIILSWRTFKSAVSVDELDRTVRLRTREARQAQRDAESASESKSEFLAKMSHEIRTPMNAIIGLSMLAARTNLNPRQRDYIEKISGAGETLLGIINDILDFSKIEAGKMTIEKIPFDLHNVIRKVSNVSAGKANEKGVELLFYVDSQVPLKLISDPLRLEQVILNLTNNAIKFTGKGEIVVKVNWICEEGHAPKIRCMIKDTGVGLTEAQIGNLFNSFTQADNSTTREFGGTGLGLVICKEICELMNGRIWVESEYGVGSTFSFEIEVAECDIHMLQTQDIQRKKMSGVRKKCQVSASLWLMIIAQQSKSTRP